MPYIDNTGLRSGWSEIPQPGLGLVDWVDEAPLDPPRVPFVVSRFQGREAMWQTPHGETTLFEAAEAIINHQDTPATYKRAWTDLQEFRRDSEMLQAIAETLELTSADLDAIFILAESIKA